MFELLSNVFYDPSNPWYYVIGVIFLVLIFGALAAYVILSKKFGKGKDNPPTEISDAEKGEEPAPNADSDAAANAEADVSGENADDNQ